MPVGSDALAELHRRDRERGIDPFSFGPDVDNKPQRQPAPREPEVTEEEPSGRPPPRREPLDAGTTPPGPRPNLEQAKRWQAQQMRPGS